MLVQHLQTNLIFHNCDSKKNKEIQRNNTHNLFLNPNISNNLIYPFFNHNNKDMYLPSFPNLKNNKEVLKKLNLILNLPVSNSDKLNKNRNIVNHQPLNKVNHSE